MIGHNHLEVPRWKKKRVWSRTVLGPMSKS